MRPNFFVNTPDILHAFLQYGGPAAFKIRAVLAATGLAELGRLRRLRALRARGGAARAARSTSTRRSTRSGSATGRPPSAEGRTLAPYLTRLNEIRRAPPRAAAAAQPDACTPATTTPSLVFTQVAKSRRASDDTVIVVVNVDPHGTRETMVHLDLPALGLDWDDHVRGARRDHRRDLDLGRAQLRPPRPRTYEPAHVLTVRRPCVTEHSRRDPWRTEGATVDPEPDPDARLVQDRGLLRGAGPLVQGLQRRRRRRLQRAHREARLPRVARRRLPVGAAVLHLAAARRRLRRRRLHQHPARGRHRRGLPRLPRRGARARHPGDHRLRHEPHLGRAPVVPGQPRGPRRARTATSTSGPTPTSSTRTPGSSSSTPSRRTGPGTRCASSTSGTGSSPTSRTSTSTTRRSTTRCSRRCRFWLDMGLDGFRLDAVPYLYERPGTNGENLPETHEFLKKVRRFVDDELPRPGAARRGQPVAGRRRRLLRRHRRPVATSATCASTSR